MPKRYREYRDKCRLRYCSSIVQYSPILHEHTERQSRSRSILMQFPSACCSPVAKCTQISSIESLATIEIDIILSATPPRQQNYGRASFPKPDNRSGLSLSKLDYPVTSSLKSAGLGASSPSIVFFTHQPNIIKHDFTSKIQQNTIIE